MLEQLKRTWQRRGFKGVWAASKQKLFASPAASFHGVKDRLRGQIGLEIGGPSAVFRGNQQFPLYPLVGRLDCTTFSYQTMWEGQLEQGGAFVYAPGKESGRQIICDGSDLSLIADQSYDFLISSHVIEHIANPIAALKNWQRVLRDDGTMVLIAPHHADIYDHRRPVTRMEHLVDDFQQGIQEDDVTHLEESLALHDYGWDPASLKPEEFKRRALDNHSQRVLHHHVFDRDLLAELVQASGFVLEKLEWCHPCHIIAIARKGKSDA